MNKIKKAFRDWLNRKELNITYENYTSHGFSTESDEPLKDAFTAVDAAGDFVRFTSHVELLWELGRFDWKTLEFKRKLRGRRIVIIPETRISVLMKKNLVAVIGSYNMALRIPKRAGSTLSRDDYLNIVAVELERKGVSRITHRGTAYHRKFNELLDDFNQVH